MSTSPRPLPRVKQSAQQPQSAPSLKSERIIPPTELGQWSLSEIIFALSRPIPESCLSFRRQSGQILPYISWHTAVKILNKYALGWHWEISKMEMSPDRLFTIGRLTLPTKDGNICREATGTELLKRLNDNGEKVELAYGDPSSNAESMAFRRAAAKFGLGLYLYERD